MAALAESISWVGALAQLANTNTTTSASVKPFTMFFILLPPCGIFYEFREIGALFWDCPSISTSSPLKSPRVSACVKRPTGTEEPSRGDGESLKTSFRSSHPWKCHTLHPAKRWIEKRLEGFIPQPRIP